MVDVTEKSITTRTAKATAIVSMLPQTVDVIRGGTAAKGDVLAIARLAGIMATKRTPELIPLCHAIPIEAVEIEAEFLDQERLQITAIVKTTARTGVEMEAMVAASTAALTVYDMCKGIDRGMAIQSVQLREKTGGRSGSYVSDSGPRPHGG